MLKALNILPLAQTCQEIPGFRLRLWVQESLVRLVVQESQAVLAVLWLGQPHQELQENPVDQEDLADPCHLVRDTDQTVMVPS